MRMKSKIAVVALASIALFVVLIGCQTKEVTSAKVYIQQDNWDKAIEQLEQAATLTPNDPEVFRLLGEGYGNRGEWVKMNEMFDKSLAISPKFEIDIKGMREKYWVNTFNNGVNKINGGDTEGAVEKFKEAIAIDPNHGESYKNLAYAYIKTENLEGAIQAYEDLLKLKPEDNETIHSLANLYFQTKNFDRVVTLEQQALQNNPADVDAVSNLALAYDFLGEKDKAQAEYEKALANNPNDKDLLFNLARLHYLNGDYDKAVALFEKVIASNPDDHDANLSIGNAYLNMGDAMRKKMVEKETNNQTVTLEEMDALKNIYRQAIPYLEKALTMKPDNANAWNNLGVAYVNIGEAEKGKQAFDKSEELRK